MEEERDLAREEIFECCTEIFNHFDNLNPKDEELTLMRFAVWMTSSDVDFLANIFEKSDLKLEGRKAEDIFYEFGGGGDCHIFCYGIWDGKRA